LIAFVAEVAIVTWRWGHSPTHGIRDWYEGSFQSYIVDNVGAWLIVFTVLCGSWLLIAKVRNKKKV